MIHSQPDAYAKPFNFIPDTLKYAYLLFASDSKLDLDEWVLNTEVHLFR